MAGDAGGFTDEGATRGQTEGSTLERRIVLRVVEVLNLVFLAVDLALYGAHAYRVLGGRLLVSTGLFAADRILSAHPPPRAYRWALAASTLALVAGFALLASGSGGAASPYLAFLGFVPIVLTIVVPDEPAVTLWTGASATLVGIAVTFASDPSPARLAFTFAAFGSCTFYGTMSALLYRRMRRREAAAAARREQAIAELARSERLRLEAERMAAVGRLAAGFGHEVNSPLASAISNLGFVHKELARAGLDPEAAEALSDTKEALGRIHRLVVDLRTLTAKGTAQPAGTDLAAAVDRALGLAAARLGPVVRADRCVPSDLPLVRASPEHLSQILSLLISAVSDRRGPGRWPWRPKPSPFAISATAVGDSVRVVVGNQAADGERASSGTGERFSAQDPGGVGLSIALCRELAERWGGRIEVDTSPEGAVRFTVTLTTTLAAEPSRPLIPTLPKRV
jgi:two-component system, NtrC family, sensor kinase